jgi:4-amino-4-deoxy-L-arabinose transferase-like glycosyltransferase
LLLRAAASIIGHFRFWEFLMDSVRPCAKYNWPSALLIATAVFAVYLFVSSRTTLWDRDEARFARATVEMVQSGNYLYPTFNDKLRPDKPILIYWIMSVPVRLFGPTEWACRSCSAIGTAVTCFLVFLIGRRLFNSKVGIIAMIVLASTLMMLYIGTASTADGILLPCLVGLMTVFAYAISDRPHAGHLILLSVLFGLAALAKSVAAGFALPGMLFTIWLLRRDYKYPVRLASFAIIAFAVGVLIFLAWFIPANNATGGEFFRLHFGHHVGERATEALESHGGKGPVVGALFLFYYIPVMVVFFFPWSLFLPGAISAIAGRRLGDKTSRAFLIGWTMPFFIVMSIVATKLPHYIIFIWPALALAVSAALVSCGDNLLNRRDKMWLERGGWFFTPIAVGMAVMLAFGPFVSGILARFEAIEKHAPAILAFFNLLAGMRIPAVIAGVLLMAWIVCVLRPHLQDRFDVSARRLPVGFAVIMIPVLFGILPAIEKTKHPPFLARTVRAAAGPDTEIATFKFDEPTLNFYIGRHLNQLKAVELVCSWLNEKKPGILIIPEKRLAEIETKYNVARPVELDSRLGIRYSNEVQPEVIVAVMRNSR